MQVASIAFFFFFFSTSTVYRSIQIGVILLRTTYTVHFTYVILTNFHVCYQTSNFKSPRGTIEVRTELNKMLFIVLNPPQPAEVAKLTGQKQFAAYWRRPLQLLADSSINKLPSNIRGKTFCVFEGTTLSRECCLFILQQLRQETRDSWRSATADPSA